MKRDQNKIVIISIILAAVLAVGVFFIVSSCGNKAPVGGGGGVIKPPAAVGPFDNLAEYDLPAELVAGTKYYFFYSDELYLSTTDTGVGIWHFNKVTKLFNQIYSEGQAWQHYVLVDGGFLVSSSSSPGLLYFDFQAKEFSVLLITGTQYCQYSFLVDGGVLLCGYSTGVYLYDNQTKTVILLYSVASLTYYFHPVDDGVLVSTRTNGLLFFSGQTKLISLIYSGVAGFTMFHDVLGGVLLDQGGLGVSSTMGIYFYDVKAHTVSQKLSSSGVNNFSFHDVLGGCLIGNSNWDLLFYDELTQLISTVYTGFYGYFYDVAGGCLVSALTGSEGILYYDNQTKTAVQKYSYGHTWSRHHGVVGGVLIGSQGLSSLGVLFYDEVSKQISVKYAYGFLWIYFFDLPLPPGELHAFTYISGGGGVLVYNQSNKWVLPTNETVSNYTQSFTIDKDLYLVGNNKTFIFWANGQELVDIVGGQLFNKYIFSGAFATYFPTKKVKNFEKTYNSVFYDNGYVYRVSTDNTKLLFGKILAY